MNEAQARLFLDQLFRGIHSPLTTKGGAESAGAILFGGGTDAVPVTTGTASKNFADFRTKTTDATGADSRGLYWRHELGGAGSSGESGRFRTVVTGAGAVGVHGVHNSVSFSGSGTLTGLAVANRATVEVPNAALAGTNAAVMAEYNAAGTSSDIGQMASFLRAALSGDATGLGKIEDDINLLEVTGGTNATGNVVGATNGDEPAWTGKTCKVRCNFNGTKVYLIGVTD